MFKAKLIDDKTYYHRRNKQMVLFLLLTIPVGLLPAALEAPPWATILVLGAYITTFIFMVNNQKLMLSNLGTRLIEIDGEELRVKSNKGKLLQSFEINSLQKISVKDAYGIPNDNLKDMAFEIVGNPKMNYVILTANDQNFRFDFEIDSYYMTDQLIDVIQHWKTKGYTIETAENKKINPNYPDQYSNNINIINDKSS